MSGDKNLRWLAKSNLRKNRLVKHFPNEVAHRQKLSEKTSSSKT